VWCRRSATLLMGAAAVGIATGVILFTPGIHDVIHRVPDGGGQPVAVTKVKKEGAYGGSRWPYFLPDGRHFLYVGIEGDDPKGKGLRRSPRFS